MQNLIVADIFGRTKALEEFATVFSEPSRIHDPYSAQNLVFKCEAEAYRYFSEHVTLENYAESLSHCIQAIDSAVRLIGFSVGASAIWKISDNPKLNHVSSATGFYGSQIRNLVDIQPQFPIELIFPASEPHFSVDDLMSKLDTKNDVTLTRVPYSHGFMNPHSVNYHQTGYTQEVSALGKSSYGISQSSVASAP
ncbi:MAG: hypothetical protein ACFHVJ_08585 [Aestuariibacter sp.]